MCTKKIIGLGLIAIGIVSVLFMGLTEIMEKSEVEQEPELDLVTIPTIPTTIELLGFNATQVQNGSIERKFTHGDTEIIYSVGVENGVEETPSPRVLKEMRDSYSPEEQKRIDDYLQTIVGKRLETGIIRFTGEPYTKEMYEMNKIRLDDKLRKQYIDSIFTCDNFGDLAKRYVVTPLYTDGWAGSTEGYIYHKAVNECYDTKIQEKLDKVTAELEEVNKPNE